jgi:hypothetical protein
MPKFNGTFPGLKFNRQKYEVELKKILRQELILAAQTWIDVVLSLVPYWTGESQGSLGPLASKINRFVPVAIRDSSATASENRLSKGKAQGKGEIRVNGFRATMFWDSTVPHLIFNEQNNAPNPPFHLRFPTPYHFRDAAQVAFFQQVLKSFPAKLIGSVFELKEIKI